MNAGPLSEPKSTGRPYLGIISSSSFLTTVAAVSSLVGKALVRSEKVSMKVN